ncbi:organic hydroperoxide resistance protein [Acinetobacter sp. ULE_I010]|uniref:organic hydroperoxide resistance protein n=1 Tax=Acinetobacter sp. ULE_I010 TaxID=3373065 RepID=UPI003AF92E70
MSTLYSTQVKAVGGRNGNIHSEDDLLNLSLALPKALGGKGDATNPEQLFAAGYASCFGNAVIHVSRNKNNKVRDNDIQVIATVGLKSNDHGGFALTVALEVTITDLDQETAELIVSEADKVCPYSNAIRGNIEVTITVKIR